MSIRTLRDDIKVFRNKINGFNAPLPENIRILRYSNPKFSIAKRPGCRNTVQHKKKSKTLQFTRFGCPGHSNTVKHERKRKTS